VLVELDSAPAGEAHAVRNNAGGHANHSLFWEIMSPDGGGEPIGSLAEAIDDTFGGFDELKQLGQRRRREALRLRLVVARLGRTGLAVYSTPNQDSPTSRTGTTSRCSASTSGSTRTTSSTRTAARVPRAWWNVVNWDAVQQRFDAVRASDEQAGPRECPSDLSRKTDQLRIVLLLAAR
jgi:Fe-Mn family superoxide dismutase